MARTRRTPEQNLELLHQQELKLRGRRKAAEAKLREHRDREFERKLASLVQVLKRHGIHKLTPERLESALAAVK